MIDLNQLIQIFIAFSFMIYGVGCFLSTRAIKEFQRYKMSNWRKTTGALQIATSLGLLIGFYIPIATTLSSAVLAGMMFVALLVRRRIRDSALKAAPATFYFALNLYLFYISIQYLDIFQRTM